MLGLEFKSFVENTFNHRHSSVNLLRICIAIYVVGFLLFLIGPPALVALSSVYFFLIALFLLYL